MKRFLLILLCSASVSIYAQFNTGSVYFSGLTDANLGIEFSESNTNLPFGLYVEGGYFVKNRLAIGGSLHTHGYIGFGEFNSSLIEVRLGPNIRYYLPREDDIQIYYYGHAYYGFISGGERMYGAYAGAGVNYFLTERVALEGRAAYNFHRQGIEAFHYNRHSILFEFGISVFFPSITFFDRS